MAELARQENVAIPTIWRWRQKGVRGVRLETFLAGGRRFTTAEAFARFVEATTAAADGVSTPYRTNRQRERDISKAEAELDRAGI